MSQERYLTNFDWYRFTHAVCTSYTILYCIWLHSIYPYSMYVACNLLLYVFTLLNFNQFSQGQLHIGFLKLIYFKRLVIFWTVYPKFQSWGLQMYTNHLEYLRSACILLVLKEVMIGIEIYIDFKTEIFFTLMKNDPQKVFSRTLNSGKCLKIL